MIKANELRIGNCVLDSTGQIRFINHRKLSDIASNPGSHGYNPITLTEEILLKSGFIKLISDTVKVIWSSSLKTNCKEFSIISDGLDSPTPLYFAYDLGYGEVKKEVKYLHELQNLYFALTGEELKINL